MLETVMWPAEAPMEALVSALGGLGLSAAWVIVALTAAVRLALAPLARRQARSVWILRGLSPVVGELLGRFPERAEQRERLMELYARNRVAPFSPLLLLIPQGLVFLGLYRVITDDAIGAEGAFGIVSSLAAPVWGQPGAWLLMALAAASTDAAILISARRTGADAFSWMTRMLLVFLPAGMFLSAYYLPAGLALYLAASGLIGVLQALWLRRLAAGDPPLAPAEDLLGPAPRAA